MSPQERFDPRAKLALVVAFVIAAFLTGAIRSQLILLGLFAVIVLVTDEVGGTEWVRSLAPLAVLVVFLIGINTVFYASGPAWIAVPIGPVELSLTAGGLQTAGLIAVRLVLVASVAAWFSQGTETGRFEAALTQSGVPWRFAFMLSLTIRLVPELKRRFQAIEDSQRSRGLDFSGGPIARTRARIPMLIPFFVATIRAGYELSTALRARGFDEPGPRTSITTVRHRWIDIGLYLLGAGVLVGTVLLR